MKESERGPMKNPTAVERKSDRELVVTRTFDGPVQMVFEAWTRPEFFKQWWVPKSLGMSMISCEMDVRTGGGYRMVFKHPDFPEPMAFFGKYTEVVPNACLTWTNEEGADGPVTTVTFEEKDGRTLLALSELYPSKKALDDAIASGSTGTSGAEEQFEQLDDLLVTLVAS